MIHPPAVVHLLTLIGATAVAEPAPAPASDTPAMAEPGVPPAPAAEGTAGEPTEPPTSGASRSEAGELDLDDEDDEAPLPRFEHADTIGDELNLSIGYVSGWSAAPGSAGQRMGRVTLWTVCDTSGPIRPGLFAYAAGDMDRWSRIKRARTTTQWIGRAGLVVGTASLVGMIAAIANDDVDIVGPLFLGFGVGIGTAVAVPAYASNWQRLVALQYDQQEAEALLESPPGPNTQPSLDAARRALPPFYSSKMFGMGRCSDVPQP